MDETRSGIFRMIVSMFILAILVTPAASASPAVQRPNPPVIHLHYDYMVFPDHSDAPHNLSIQMVVDAFRAHGIQLIIDPQHTAIPGHLFLYLGDQNHAGNCGLPDAVSFYDLEAQYFHPRSNLPWHYAIFGDYVLGYGPENCDIVSGASQLPGFSFAVGTRAFFAPYYSPGHFKSKCITIGFDSLPAQGCYRAEGGTFMHELGHNLGLRHGGDDEVNGKPNYLSVMNYAFQTTGIPSAASPGGSVPVSWRLDYSERLYPPLDESALNETAGLGGPANDSDITRFSWFYNTGLGWGIVLQAYGASTGPIDWNHNGIIEPKVQADINANFEVVTPVYSVLYGFNDWMYIQQFLNTPKYIQGLETPQTIES